MNKTKRFTHTIPHTDRTNFSERWTCVCITFSAQELMSKSIRKNDFLSFYGRGNESEDVADENRREKQKLSTMFSNNYLVGS